MRTYWLLGEDPTQRLARIRKEMHGSSLFSSISSERKIKKPTIQAVCTLTRIDFSGLSETPDLLRRPGSNLLGLVGAQNPPSASQSECPLLELHERARQACSMDSSHVRQISRS